MGDIKVLFDAIHQGNLDKVKSIITPQNINIKNNDGYTPLHYAVFWDKVDIVKYLVSQGADTNSQLYDNTSVLRTAKYFKIDEIIKCLTDAGATVDTKRISQKNQYDDNDYHLNNKYDKKINNHKIKQFDCDYSNKYWGEFNKNETERFRQKYYGEY